MELSEERYQISIKIESMLSRTPQLPPLYECCIYKVPHRLRKLNPDAYTPKIVSIGPFHHRGNPQLKKMEDHKQCYCQDFIRRSEASLDDLVNLVKELEPRVRRCYSENIKLSVEEFMEVIFVDCCFTLEFLLRDRSKYATSSIEPWLKMDIKWDLMLIENQLPFFVYHDIFELAFPYAIIDGEKLSFMEVASYWLPFVTVDEGMVVSAPINKISHFIDLHRHYCASKGQSLRGYEFLTHFYSATTLKEAGVKFRVHKESKGSLDLKFSGNCLKIPEFKVEAGTEMLLRNIIAFEQCHYFIDPYFTNYIELIDFLINTEKDVDILVSNKIIINWLGDSKAVSKMVNGLCENVELRNTNTNYIRIRNDLDAYCEHWWHRRMATLRRDYCNTPWKTVASIAAIALLLLTITQTVFSILQVV